MNPSFEHTLVEVWRQVLIENASVVELDGKRYSVHITPRKGLRQVDFMFDRTESCYVANVVDEKATLYGR